MACCVAWRQVLELPIEKSQNLTVREFLSTHNVWRINRNLCSFCSRTGNRVVHLGRHYSHAEEWQRKFFLFSGTGWEFPSN